MEQKINVPYDSSGGNFPNPLISVNNVYNCDAFPWPKNTVLIGRVSKINDINKKVSLQPLDQLKLEVLVTPR